jgi:predicted RNA-binding Zn-ribbon protein involved in translation (DUF1610 family)
MDDVSMAEQIKIVKLNCANCGGVLEIRGDMDQFACGYCGSAQIVERRGGTVALRLVVDAVARVQAGTDRTAAELALVRLEKEIVRVNTQWQVASRAFSLSHSSSSSIAVIGMACALIIGMVALVGALASGGSPGQFAVFFVLVVGAIAAFVFCFRQNTEAGKRYAAKRSELWAPYGQRIQGLEQLIKKHRKMVD